MDRRAFLQSGLALSAASLPGTAALAAAVGMSECTPIRLQRFVFDKRFAEAVETARHAAHLGIHLAEISGDVTPLWYDDLDLRWKRAPMALAGVTTQDGLFVLETLAADRGMRVAYRGEHGVAKNDNVDHVLTGPPALIARAALQSDTPLWGAVIGDAMAHCPPNTPAVTHRFATGAGDAPARDVPLYSWIIAPRAAVAVA